MEKLHTGSTPSLTLLCLHAAEQGGTRPSGLAGRRLKAPALVTAESFPCDAIGIYGGAEDADVMAALESSLRDRLPTTPLLKIQLDGDSPAALEKAFAPVHNKLPASFAVCALMDGLSTPLKQAWMQWAKSRERVQCIQGPEDPWLWSTDPTAADTRPLQVNEPSAAWAVPRMAPAMGAALTRNPAVVQQQLGILAKSAGMQQALKQAEQVARHGVPVMIAGETGTGKESLARFIHLLSGRDAETFVPINCGALPATLAESILFGHSRGAFTGAHTDQTGKFQQADGGSLFLDELGELPIELQPKLLRVLEEQVVEPLGSTKTVKVNTRLIGATHNDLPTSVAEGRFREDLYYRLSFATVKIPPLRERPDDIPLIALHYLQQLNHMLEAPRELTASALERLCAHSWPGNVRDLQNVLGRSALWSEQTTLDADDLRFDVPGPSTKSGLPEPAPGFSMEDYVKELRTKLIQRALEKSDGHQSKAAALLGISPQAVSKYLKSQDAGR